MGHGLIWLSACFIFIITIFLSIHCLKIKGENSVTHEIGPINSDFSKNIEQMKKRISVF